MKYQMYISTTQTIPDEFGNSFKSVDFFTERVLNLEAYQKVCNPKVVNIVGTSIELNKRIRDSLIGKTTNQGH